jgi:glycosyltransferase involved in cell wall biosynthesis
LDIPNPLRILFSLPGLHRVNRGAEVVLEEVAARAAADPNFDVTVFGSGPSRPNQPYRYRRLRGIRRDWFEKFPKLPYVRDHYMWEELTHAPSLYSKFRPRDYDVTVTCGYPYSNMLLRRGRKGGHRPAHVFITQNGDWMVQAKNAEYKHFGCDGLVCTNPEYYERHKNTYPAALIPNGVDTTKFFPRNTGNLPVPTDRNASGVGSRQSEDSKHGQDARGTDADEIKGTGAFISPREQFHLPEKAPIILIVSALIPSKKVLDGIRAAANLPDAYLIIAGDGEQRHEVETLANQLLKNRHTRLTVPREKMPDLYRAADVLLHMSQDEPFGNIYIEALATGLPIVAHQTPVTQWILEDQAQLIDTSDLPAVTRALQTAIAQGSTDQVAARRNLAQNRFSWPAVTRQYCDFFQQVFSQTN